MSFLVGVLAVGAGVIGAVLHVVNITAGRGVEPSFWLLSALGALAYGGVAAVLARRSRVPRIPLVLGAIGLGQALALVLPGVCTARCGAARPARALARVLAVGALVHRLGWRCFRCCFPMASSRRADGGPPSRSRSWRSRRRP